MTSNASPTTIYSSGYDDELIVQEYLGRWRLRHARRQHRFRPPDGRLRALSAAQVVLTERNPLTLGNYNAVVTIDDATLTEQIRHLLDSVGYVGPANFDIMIDRAHTGRANCLRSTCAWEPRVTTRAPRGSILPSAWLITSCTNRT